MSLLGGLSEGITMATPIRCYTLSMYVVDRVQSDLVMGRRPVDAGLGHSPPRNDR